MQPEAISKSFLTGKDGDEQGIQKQATVFWQRIALGLIILLAVILNFVRLGQNHFADITTGVNSYYAVAVKSMGLNWHNFFFAALQPPC